MPVRERGQGPISAACSLTEERPSIECVQVKAWALPVEGCDLPGGTASMPVRERGQGEPTPGQHVPFSGHVQAHTPGERRAFAPAATEGTGETDSPQEGGGFEPPVPLAETSRSFRRSGKWRRGEKSR